MPMLSDMRKRVRVVMIVVAVAFVAGFLMSELWRSIETRGSNRGRDTHGYVGRIGDHNVTPEEYRAAVSYMTDKYKTENRLRDLSNEDYQTIEEQAWKYLIHELTWAKVRKAGHIGVTQDEILEIVRSNPPQELVNHPDLMTDGKFDQQKYLQTLNAPENRAYFSKYAQQLIEMLPQEKFRIDVINAYRPTNAEVEDALAAANTHWQTTSLYFGAKVMQQPYEPTEDEAKAWFEAHKDSFRTKEAWQLHYVLFPLAVTAQDSADAKELIDRAYDQLQKGETFNLTTLDFSDLNAETMPALTPREGLDKPTDSILRRLKPGQYSTPYLAPYGWLIARLDSATKDSVAYRRILVRVKMGTEQIATMRDSVRLFLEQASHEKFDTLAARFGLTVQPVRPIIGDQKDLVGLDIESPGQLIEWAKKTKPVQVYDQPLRGPAGYYVVALVDVKPAGYSEYEKVKRAVIFRMRLEKEKAAWIQVSEQALAALKAGASFEQYAAQNPTVELQRDSFAGLTDARRKKGPEFAGALAALNPGEKTGVIETRWGAFIVRCDAKTDVAMLDASDYVEQRRAQVGQDVMAELLKQPEVKDYRDALAY
ncbi:peptidyl-prolyl cis-trans isomerase [candidate division WOR-3 bacterium]|nr:peptidyl-prolyl cis-trans isomerase [candidate division WOR-3 bacterium]